MHDITIHLRQHHLMDGSHVFDIILRDQHGGAIEVNATDEQAALDLMDGLCALVAKHTINSITAY